MLDPGKPVFTPKKGKPNVVMFVGLQDVLGEDGHWSVGEEQPCPARGGGGPPELDDDTARGSTRLPPKELANFVVLQLNERNFSLYVTQLAVAVAVDAGEPATSLMSCRTWTP
ncbi:uncharacterized protein LOC125534913 [Triticum urartu]|uniref:uncharacterized protein LOC125528687 n=1 Tax=Triticum urartu TaxID=4572 RepID=UPI0020447723|nr:uncharacterized protein LOC125528687 [Triticum urartu]XP_048553914.1 uncharacterized protein LOC125534913 [Triticum urartu]